MKDALVAAGQVLAQAVRAGLAGCGLPCDVSLRFGDGRVHVVSASRDVQAAETGSLAHPPTATMEVAARAATQDIMSAIGRHLRESER